MNLSDTWAVRIPNRVKPMIEAIAREEERVPAQVVRRLVDSALAQRALTQRPPTAGGLRRLTSSRQRGIVRS
jgi:hypothetical protein